MSFRCAGRKDKTSGASIPSLGAPRGETIGVHRWVKRGASRYSERPEGTYQLSRSHRGWRLRLHHREGRKSWYRATKAACLEIADRAAEVAGRSGLDTALDVCEG